MKTSKLVMGLQHTPFRLATPYLNGVGQIMLQNNPWTGLLFLVGIFCGSIPMGIASLVSVITGTLTANVLRYDPDKIHDGLYGFSATLVGVALLCFFQSSVAIWIAVIVGSALATIIQHTFIVKNIPAFTLPFILVVWLVLAIIRFYPTFVEPQHAISPPLSDNYFTLLSRGFGQVIFQDTLWAGMFFFIGILIHRPIAAVYALFSVALSSVLAFALHESASDIHMGLLSYNAVSAL